MKPWPLLISIIVILAFLCSPGLAISKSDLLSQYQIDTYTKVPSGSIVNPTIIPITTPTQSPSGSGTPESYVYQLQWGFEGTGDGQFTYPRGVAVDGLENVYVVEWGYPEGDGNHRVQKFSSDGTFITKWGSVGNGDGQFKHPNGVAVDGSGNVYVADGGNHRIQKFTSNGVFIMKWGSEGTGDCQFCTPNGVAVDVLGNVYVTNYGEVYIRGSVNSSPNASECWASTQRIQKFSSDGTFITAWGSYGSGIGQFKYPMGVAVDASGNVYVADSGNNRIQKFSSDGTFITTWGSEGSGDSQFMAPEGVAVDASGNVYVAEWGQPSGGHRIQKFTSTGMFLAKWGSFGTGAGQFHSPDGVAVDALGNVYVAEFAGNHIQKFIRNTGPESNVPTMVPTTVLPTKVPTAEPTQVLSETGSVSISSSPAGALVYLDGALKGFTPITLTGVSVGLHQVKLTKPGYSDYATSVTVVTGETHIASATLTPKSGSLWLVPTSIPTKIPTNVPTMVPTTVPTTAPTVPDSYTKPTVIFGSIVKPTIIPYINPYISDIPSRKPNIYLYSDRDLTAKVQLAPENAITVSKPTYQPGKGWRAEVRNGSLNGTGDFLFYEALVPNSGWQKKEGYVLRAVYREQDMAFMLGQYGFNEKETVEFIDYWASHLIEDVDYVFYPQETGDVNRVMPLYISPKPDEVSRIWYYAEPLLSAPEPVTHPEKIVREGFYVVEWGVIIQDE